MDKSLSELDAEAKISVQAIHDELSAIEARLDDKTAGSVDFARAIKLIMKLIGLARTP